VLPLLVIVNVDPISQILFTLIEAIFTSGTSGLTGPTSRDVPEEGILHKHRR
jgi:hypothetical protein